MPRWVSAAQHKSLEELGKRPLDPEAHARLKLRQYLIDHEITVAQFSAQCCMQRRVLDDVLAGRWSSKGGYLQLHQAFAIEWATRGVVMAWEWLDDPYFNARIRASRMSWLKDFECRIKPLVLQWNTLKQPEAMLRYKARVLSRLFNVQWGEVKKRAWRDAEKAAMAERADISHLIAPELSALTDDDIWVSSKYPELSHDEWFDKIRQESPYGHERPGRLERQEDEEDEDAGAD